MDNERLLAAKKKLREYQMNKRQDQRKKGSVGSDGDPIKVNNDQRSSENSTPEKSQELFQFMQTYVDSKENSNKDLTDAKYFFESPQFNKESDQSKNFITSEVQFDVNIQNNLETNQVINGTSQVQPFDGTFPDNSRSSSTNSSQLTNENVEKNMQDENNSTLPAINEPYSTSTSLQKEYLLQMANDVANVLEHDLGANDSVNSSTHYSDLEEKNQFLTQCLEEQKRMVNQLHIQLGQCSTRISELEAIVATKEAHYEGMLLRELGPLKEQIQLDAQTIGILVAEKAELTATNTQFQTVIQQKTDDVKELFSKFKESQYKINNLESELTAAKNSIENISSMYEQLQTNYKDLDEKASQLKKENESFEMDNSELKQKLNYKSTEVSNLQQELQEKLALLQLSEIRLNQLTNAPHEMSSLETQHQTTKALEQQLSQMKQTLTSLSGEKDEVSKNYQNYIQQLDERNAKLVAELESSKKRIVDSEIREQSYIQRLSELELHLQKEKDKIQAEEKISQPFEDQSAKIEMLTKSMDNLVLEQENLQSLMNQKDNEIEILKRELQELQEFKERSVEATKLATALQSEQLGASRAVSQNQQLKSQLEEMQNAFISLSNTKLDLTEQLQAERTIGKKLNAHLNHVEKQMDELKEILAEKEATLVEYKKEKLQAAQIEDQIQHYQAQSHSSTTLQHELQKAMLMIETLKSENKLLRSKLEPDQEEGVAEIESLEENATENETVNESETIKNSNDQNESLIEKNNQETPKNETVISEVKDNIKLAESFKKLEKKFTESMKKLADVVDEKQKLEHLVLQLQGETETIGEYVSLYQKQRAVLNEKAKERENTFRVVLEQRNQQQEQLHKLKLLVAELLKSNRKMSVPTAIAAEENLNISESTGEEIDPNKIKIIEGQLNKVDMSSNLPDDTTSQIMDLLTEIKDCNTCVLEPNFQPCPCCSGKLITV
ncbi:hypothetical protein TKK_0006427 [Trichogramma kaykai]|uniref:Golgin subfamily A conserved domain-containing protein n=1 Tax=Trichogramma kaykai TaxID=54128 RepID=A0ABD2XDL0_9HYME